MPTPFDPAAPRHDRRDPHDGDPRDELDFRIIHTLQRDPLLTNRALARALGVAQSTVSTRLKQLRESRILRLIPMVDAAAAGYDLLVLTGIRVRGPMLERVAEEISKIPEAIDVYIVSGDFDLSGRMIARDRRHLRDLIEHRIGSIAGITQVQCDIALGVQIFGPSLKAERDFPDLALEIDGTDALDRAVIRRLQRDARTPLSAIAREEGVSEGTVRLRFRKLQDRGLLRIVAATDPRATGNTCLSWVEIVVHPAQLSALGREVGRRPQVASLVYTLNGNSVFVLVAVRDRDELSHFLTNELLRLPGVERTRTGELLRVFKHDDRWTLAPDVAP